MRIRVNNYIEYVDFGETSMGGPHHLGLFIKGVEVKNRVFLEFFCQSEDANLFAITETILIQKKRIEYEQIAIFNLESEMVASVGRSEDVYIKPLRFEQDKLIFSREAMSLPGIVQEYGVSYKDIKNWSKIF